MQIMAGVTSPVSVTGPTAATTSSDPMQKKYVAVTKEALKNPDKPYVLNMAKDEEYQLVKNNYQNAGLTPERYPQLFNQLETARNSMHPHETPVLEFESDEDGFSDDNIIERIGETADGKACAKGTASFVGGANSVVMTLLLYNLDTFEEMASASTHAIGEGEKTSIEVKSQSKAPKDFAAVLFVDYTKEGSKKSNHVIEIEAITTGAVHDPEITQPIQKPKHKENDAIIIGLSRGLGNRENVDYWFNRKHYSDTTVMIPLVGKVTFTSKIKPLVLGQTINLKMTVGKRGGGAKSLEPKDYKNVFESFRIDPTDLKTLLFNKYAPTDVNSIEDGNPIVFGKANWSADTTVYFKCKIEVKTENSGDDFEKVYITSEDVDDPDEWDGRLYIKPLKFTWHCLAQGTMITMADGSKKKIEDLQGGEAVLMDNNGRNMRVNATFVGEHNGKVVVLETADKAELTLSDTHVVAVPDGLKLAHQLKTGDIVITRSGPQKLISAKQIKYNGFLFNLELGSFHQQRQMPKESFTMFANGFRVGDQTLQSYYFETYRKSDKLVKEALPREWHKDFESLVDDIKMGV